DYGEVAPDLRKARNLVVVGSSHRQGGDFELEKHWRICKVHRLDQGGVQLSEPAHWPPAAQDARGASRVQAAQPVRRSLEDEGVALTGRGQQGLEVALHVKKVDRYTDLTRDPPLFRKPRTDRNAGNRILLPGAAAFGDEPRAMLEE